jgi:hypothetical protein
MAKVEIFRGAASPGTRPNGRGAPPTPPVIDV